MFITHTLSEKPSMNKALNDTRKRASSEKVQVTLYTRPGCHLCDEAKEAIHIACCENEYTLDEVNIESDGRLLHLYRNDIPVVLIDGVEAFRHRVDSGDFRRRIATAGRSAPDIQSTSKTP